MRRVFVLLGKPFVWVWPAVTLRWLPPRARRPVGLALLYVAAAAVLARALPYRPAMVIEGLPGTSAVTPAAWFVPAVVSADGSTCAVGAMVNTVMVVVRLDRPEQRMRIACPGARGFNGMSLSPSGRYVAAWWNGDVRRYLFAIWDCASGTKVLEQSSLPDYEDEPGHSLDIVFGQDERRCAIAKRAAHSYVHVVHLPSGKLATTLHDAHAPLAFSPDGTTLATDCYTPARQLRLWDTTVGKERVTVNDPLVPYFIRVNFPADSYCSFAAKFSADGRAVTRVGVYYVSGDRNGALWAGERRYDAQTGAALDPGPGKTLLGATWHGYGLTPGHLLMSGPCVRVIHLATGAERASFPAQMISTDAPAGPFANPQPESTDQVRVHASHTGDVLVVVRADRSRATRWRAGLPWLDDLLVWLEKLIAPPRGEQTDTDVYLPGRPSPVTLPGWDFLGFGPGGRRVVTLSEDGLRLAVWDLPLGLPWLRILGGAAVVPLLVVLPGGLRRAWRGWRKAPVAV